MTIERKRRKAQAKRRKVKRRKESSSRKETIFNIIPLVVVVVITIIILRASFRGTQPDPPAPDFTVQDVITERNFTLSVTGKEQIVIVNFFGTQCSECQPVMQVLLQLRNTYAAEIVIVSLAPPSSGDTVNSLLDYQLDSDYRWLIARDSSGIAKSYGVTELPTTVIVDRNGLINDQSEGVISFAYMDNKIGTLLNEQPRVDRQLNMAQILSRDLNSLGVPDQICDLIDT
jgi:thiol-disulfide isomerase/thioredoxin